MTIEVGKFVQLFGHYKYLGSGLLEAKSVA